MIYWKFRHVIRLTQGGVIYHPHEICIIPPSHSRPKRIPRSYASLKNTPFRRFCARKTPLFQPKSLILKSNKTTLSKQNAILFSLYKIKYPFRESKINCIKHFFLCKSYFSLCLIWNEYSNTRPRSNVWKSGWKQADTCKMFTLFQNFADLCLKYYPFFLIWRIRAYLWKITPFFAKVGTSVVYVLIESGGWGWGCGYYLM